MLVPIRLPFSIIVDNRNRQNYTWAFCRISNHAFLLTYFLFRVPKMSEYLGALCRRVTHQNKFDLTPLTFITAVLQDLMGRKSMHVGDKMSVEDCSHDICRVLGGCITMYRGKYFSTKIYM